MFKVLVHVDDIGCAYQWSRIGRGLTVDRFFEVLRELDLESSGVAHFLENISCLGRVAVIQNRSNEIAVMAVTTRHRDHPVPPLPADNLKVVGREVAMAEGASIHAIEDIAFDLLF